jgi:putative transcriptional regulator
MPSAVEIGRRLRELRGGKNRDEVAKDLAISASSIGMYECGQRTPRDEVKIALADYYGKTVQAIFFDA